MSYELRTDSLSYPSDLTGKAIPLGRDLVKVYPEDLDTQRSLSVSLDNLGDHHRERGDPAEALPHYKEAFEIRERLIKAKPHALRFRVDLASSWERLAIVDDMRGNAEGATRGFEETAKLRRELCEERPKNLEFQSSLAGASLNLGRRYLELGRLEDGLKLLRESEAVFARFAERDPRYQGNLGMVRRLIGLAERELGLLNGSIAPERSEDHRLLAVAAQKAGDYGLAVKRFRKALEDPQLRSNLGNGALYAAACSAALASAAAEGEEQAALREQALAWLGENLQRYRKVQGQLDGALSQKLNDHQRARFTMIRKTILEHIEKAKSHEPAFETLRESESFKALFAKE